MNAIAVALCATMVVGCSEVKIGRKGSRSFQTSVETSDDAVTCPLCGQKPIIVKWRNSQKKLVNYRRAEDAAASCFILRQPS